MHRRGQIDLGFTSAYMVIRGSIVAIFGVLKLSPNGVYES